MFTIPIDKAIEAGVIEVKNSWKKRLTLGWGDDKIFKELRVKTKRTPKYPVKHQVLLWNIVQK